MRSGLAPQDLFLALLSGVLLTGAFPTFRLSYLAWVGLVPLFFALQGKGRWVAFRLGLAAGVAFYLSLLYWLVIPMTVYGSVSYYVAIPVMLLLVFYLSLYFGAFSFIFVFFERSGWLVRTIMVPAAWTVLDLARTYLLTGFPWGSLGYSQVERLWVIQIADVAGVYGVTFILVATNFALYQLTRELIKGRPRRLVAAPSLWMVAGLLVATALYGWNRLDYWQGQTYASSSFSVAILQGNIDQGKKWDQAFQEETVAIYDRLDRMASAQSPGLVVWPETAAPFFFEADLKYAPYIRTIPARDKTFVLLGAPGFRLNQRQVEYTNSAFLLSPSGEVAGRYDKIHLVPFGEYVPLRPVLPFITKLTWGPGDFSPGEEFTVFPSPWGEFATLICYEAIFPGLVRKFVKRGAGFLVNITNDAWFGQTGAPYQHQDMATFRAVENRVFLVRAANTGVSSLVDWTGRVVKQTDIFTEGFIGGKVSVGGKKTIYTRYGDLVSFGLTALLLGGAASSFFSSRRKG